MPAPNDDKFRLSRKERWLLVLGLLVLGALLALAIWAQLSGHYDQQWPPPTID